MNEDEITEGCVPPAEMDFFENTSKDSIPDAKYYLVRPKGSKTVYIMDLKPEYNKGPFYKACEKNMSYLNAYCISLFRVPSPCENGYNSLFVIGLVPDEDSIAYIFDGPKENKMDLKKALASTDTYKVDNEVAIHYGLLIGIFQCYLLTSHLKSIFKSILMNSRLKSLKHFLYQVQLRNQGIYQ